jgi:hypothetical protein
MLFNVIVSIFIQVFGITYKWIDQNFITHLLNFAKGFEYGIILISAIIFLLISIGFALRNAKKLPKSYIVEITDVFGNTVEIDGLRQVFSTYDGAESYARLYQKEYGNQYKFKVVGTQSKYPLKS